MRRKEPALVPFALAVLQGLGDVGRVDEAGDSSVEEFAYWLSPAALGAPAVGEMWEDEPCRTLRRRRQRLGLTT